MWIKRGVGHVAGHDIPYGLPYESPYDLPVVNFLKLGSALLQTCVNTSSVNLSYTRLPSYWRRFAKILGCGQNVGLAMAIVYAMAYPWPTLWSTGNQFSAQHCCTPVQTTYPMNLAYLRLSSVLLAAFRSNFLHRLVVDWNQRNQNAV